MESFIFISRSVLHLQVLQSDRRHANATSGGVVTEYRDVESRSVPFPFCAHCKPPSTQYDSIILCSSPSNIIQNRFHYMFTTR